MAKNGQSLNRDHKNVYKICKSWSCPDCMHCKDWDANYDGDSWFYCDLQEDLDEAEYCDDCQFYEERSG